ncbi:MAG: hypothetical protein DI607_03490 [Sphingomonas hengshuiensis]|nr:MAG: hypothetical protein DI607_03490 [Sphingomonas hengshuiensis]
MSLLVEGRRRAAENDHHDRAWLAWNTAALHRAKNMPSLKDVAGPRRTEKRKRAMTADQMLTMAHMWAAAAPPTKGKKA